ncbi:hypothetical protein MKX08_004919 [Trichoderma sp. CBMAI-0020]|nr:hypothetical protein MKX08_004919 [Trichoderma sp. CBMAI-0020]
MNSKISRRCLEKATLLLQKKRINGTGDWLLSSKEFHTWLGTPSSALLCLKGTIGTGKTYLTSKAIDHIKQILESSPQHSEGFAFFYCNRSGPSMQDPLIVLKSFVRQLASKAFGTSGVVQYSLVQKCAILTTVMQKSENPVKIFISSRPDREYLEAFADETIITVDASNQQEDIEKFLPEKLYTTKFFQQRSQVIRGKITNVFAAQGCGMFRWVYLQVMSLKRLITDKAIYNWACNLPVDLMAAYDQLWENIIQEHDESDVVLAKRAIMWVLYSFEPLEIEVLLQAIRYVTQGSVLARYEEQTEQQILSLCQDLLTIDEDRGVWMVPHVSVAEYFDKRGCMKTWECDIFASRLCLHFLDGPLPNDDCGFMPYAAKHWHEHIGRYDKWLGSRVQVAEQEPDSDLAAALKRFLGSPETGSANLRKWIQDSKESFPCPETALSAMCKYGFYYTLRDWWAQTSKITAEVALEGKYGYIWSTWLRHPKGDIYYSFALSASIFAKNFDTVDFLETEVKADVNSGAVDLERENDSDDCRDGNVLITASYWPNIESVRILLKAGANADAAVQNGWYGSALVAAAATEYTGNDGENGTEVVQLLLDHGADPNLPLKVGRWGSALEASMARKWESEVEQDCRDMQLLLLEAGAYPTAVSEYGEYGSALAAAAFWGKQEILKAMIDKVGKEHAIEALRQSRHPDEREFIDQQDIMSWKETATYLAKEVGVSKEILHTVGLWDVESEPLESIEGVNIMTHKIDVIVNKKLMGSP